MDQKRAKSIRQQGQGLRSHVRHNPPISRPQSPASVHPSDIEESIADRARKRRRADIQQPSSFAAPVVIQPSTAPTPFPVAPVIDSMEEDDASEAPPPRQQPGRNTHKCPFPNCDTKLYSQWSSLKRHLDSFHPNSSLPPNFPHFRCDQCKKFLAHRPAILSHRCALPVDPTAPSPDQHRNQRPYLPRNQRQHPNHPRSSHPQQQPNQPRPGQPQPRHMQPRNQHQQQDFSPVLADSIEADTLTTFYRQPLFKPHRTWINPLHSITTNLLQDMIAADPQVCFESTLAFYILPGLVVKIRDFAHLPPAKRVLRERLEKPVDYLRRWAASSNKPRDILQFAQLLLRDYPSKEPPPSRQQNPQAEARRLLKRAEKAFEEGQLNKAARFADSAEIILSNSDPIDFAAGPLTQAAMLQQVSELFPEEHPEEAFILGELLHDLPPSLVLDKDDILRAIRCLRTDSAPGMSG